jgi:hypothetical protein
LGPFFSSPAERGCACSPPRARAAAADRHIIAIRGAREHNLKNVDLDIPRDELVVFTGLSGSGKSSLAFDTIYAEGQRRYVESLSHKANWPGRKFKAGPRGRSFVRFPKVEPGRIADL